MGIYKETRERTKNNLVNSFWSIYENKSIDKITIKEITDKAGYNRATFYIYFKDVYDILQCIENQLLGVFENSKNFKIEDLGKEELVKYSIELFNENASYFHVLLSSKGDPFFAEQYKKKLKVQLYYTIEKNNSFPEKYSDFVLEFLAAGIISCILYWYESQPFPVEDLISIIFKIMTTGTLPE